MWLLWVLAGLILLPIVAWFYYIVIMAMAAIEDDLHPWVRFFGRKIALPFGLLLDIAVNIEASLLLFQRLPKAVLLTGTLKYWINSNDARRCKHAAMICVYLLNPFDKKRKHC